MYNSVFFNTIILLGAVQGLIVSGLLFFSKTNRQPNRLLAALIFLIALASLNLYSSHQTWFDNWYYQFFIAVFPLVVIMPLGPLIYFYVKSMLDPGFRLSRKQRVHFYPVILDLFQHVAAILYVLALVTHLIRHPLPFGTYIDTYDTWVDLPRWLSLSIYIWLSARHLAAVKKIRLLEGRSSPEHFRWLQQFIRVFLAFQALWLVHLIPYLIPRYSAALLDWADWYPLYVPLALMIYWLGIKGYLVTHKRESGERKSPKASPQLTDGVTQKALILLRQAMEQDELYLNPRLNLSVLAQHTGLGQKTISAVLNQQLHTSFNEFVNQYRVEAFKQKVRQPEMDHFTFLGLAYECGFNSQATFQRSFKQLTGKSPSEFRKARMEAPKPSQS
jgi:AraC-like DNA-binding protein